MIEKLKALRPTITHAGFCLIIAKGITSTLTVWDCLGVLIIALASQSQIIVDHLYPKRVDLYEEVMDVQDELKAMKIKSDEMDHDLTALKLGVRGR